MRKLSFHESMRTISYLHFIGAFVCGLHINAVLLTHGGNTLQDRLGYWSAILIQLGLTERFSLIIVSLAFALLFSAVGYLFLRKNKISFILINIEIILISLSLHPFGQYRGEDRWMSSVACIFFILFALWLIFVIRYRRFIFEVRNGGERGSGVIASEKAGVSTNEGQGKQGSEKP